MNATIKGLMKAGYTKKMATTLATRYSAKRAKEVKAFQDKRRQEIIGEGK